MTCTCFQDSDRLWLAAPPGRKTLRQALEARNVTLQLGWHMVRDAPLAGTHGGPECRGARAIPLAGVSRSQLADVLKVPSRPFIAIACLLVLTLSQDFPCHPLLSSALLHLYLIMLYEDLPAKSAVDIALALFQGERDNATLMSAHFLNGTAIANATLPEGEGTLGLYSYLWQLRGGDCSVNTRLGAESGWLDLAVGCNTSLAVSKVIRLQRTQQQGNALLTHKLRSPDISLNVSDAGSKGQHATGM